MNHTRFNDEVLYTADAVTCVNSNDIEQLKTMALKNPRKRIRLCAHPNTDDLLHEMLIVHAKGAYVRPHKHPQKSESFHIIQGELSIVLFEEDGQIDRVIELGAPQSEKTFYYRLSAPQYHTVIPHSDLVVFHETTNGPFDRAETVFAHWSPEEDDESAQATYLNTLLPQLNT